jgi:anaphase-promoting complex subunit 4
VIVSRLRGLSKFQPSNVTLGLSTPELDNIIDTVNCLQFVAHQILIVSGSELRQYIAFSTWLRQEIENQASDPSFPEAADEETNIDHANTLLYIEGAMMFSKLKTFFDLEPQTDPSPQWDLTAEGRSLFELYRRELKIASGQDPFAKRLPKLDALINHLDIQCTAVFGSIAETQRRNVRFGTPISLGAGIPTFMDTRMMNEVRNGDILFWVSPMFALT